MAFTPSIGWPSWYSYLMTLGLSTEPKRRMKSVPPFEPAADTLTAACGGSLPTTVMRPGVIRLVRILRYCS